MKRSPRRIALVTHGFDIGGGVPGVARWLRDGLAALGGYSVDVHDLATSSRDESSRRLVEPRSWARASLRSANGAETHHQHWGANAVELEVMRYRPRRELTRALRDYDLVQVIAGAPAWAAVARSAGVPVVLQVATRASWERQSQLAAQPFPMRTWRTAMTRLTSRIEQSALRAVDAVLVENTAMLELVRSLSPAQVIKAPPGVDTALFSPSPAGWQRDGHLLSVCRLGDPRKGLDRTIRAYAEMVRKRESIPPLILAGRGAPAEANKALVTELGLASRVIIRSDSKPADLVDLYRGASVFLQSSYEEGLGLSVLEAMACGLPVVSTQTAGSSETVLDGVTGWLVPQDPVADVPAAIADRALRILADPDCAFGLRGRGRCLSTFSTEIALTRFTGAYDALLRQR